MRLETAVPGEPAKLIASGFMTYADNATYPVLACDESTDRVIVASFGQGVAPSRLVVFRLSTGAVIRSVDYAGMLSWVAASADGTMLVETLHFDTASQRWSATIRSADDGAREDFPWAIRSLISRSIAQIRRKRVASTHRCLAGR